MGLTEAGIDHFIVVAKLPGLTGNGGEAGGDPVLIQTFVLF